MAFTPEERVERHRIANRRWNANPKTKQDRKEYNRQHYLANRQRLLEQHLERRSKDRAKAIATTKEWLERNPGYTTRYSHVRRVRKQGNGVFLVTARDLNRLLARWYHACAYCGSKENLQWDHVVPIARGGRHSIGNLLPACAKCNSSKRAKFIVEWRQRLGRHWWTQTTDNVFIRHGL